MTLRPYQIDGLNAIRRYYGQGQKKVLLVMPTGAGKTLCFCTILKSAHEKGSHALMVVRGKKLVDQASQRLDREGVDHGVIMSGHWRVRPEERVQVASIDTLYARRDKMDLPHFDLIVIDEAHMATSGSFLWLVDQYPNAFFLPVTATPYNRKGLRHIADEVVRPIRMRELIEQGFLVGAEYYTPSRVDLSGVPIDSKTGDYVVTRLDDVMNNANLFGDLLTSYRKIATGMRTLIFCVSVKHSEAVAGYFRSAGIPTAHMDAHTSDERRAAIITAFEAGELQVICNVGILTTGVDIPCVQCIMLARPTKSYSLYVQICGRGSRLYPGKEKFLVLDHANNVKEHGLVEDEPECQLDGKVRREREMTIATCRKCYHVYDSSLGDDCPKCGYKEEGIEASRARKFVTDENFELVKIGKAELSECKKRIEELLPLAVSQGYEPGWIYHKLRMDQRFGGIVAAKHTQYIRMRYKEFSSCASSTLSGKRSGD